MMRIPIAIRGGFDKKKLPSRSESSENIQLNKLSFVSLTTLVLSEILYHFEQNQILHLATIYHEVFYKVVVYQRFQN